MSELRKKVEGLKAEGATYREIQKAIHDELTQMGIAQGRRGPDRVGSLITEDQMSTLQKKIDGLVAEGASRRDIQKAINAELRSMGIDLPAQRGGRRSPNFWRGGRRGRGPDGRGGPPPRLDKKKERKKKKSDLKMIRRMIRR